MVSFTAASEIHIPVRNEQSWRTGIEEGAGKPRQRFGIALGARSSCVAGRKHDPIGVEFELGDLRCGQDAVVFRTCLAVRAAIGRREEKRGLGACIQDFLAFSCQDAMGGEMNDGEITELSVWVQMLDVLFRARSPSQMAPLSCDGTIPSCLPIAQSS